LMRQGRRGLPPVSELPSMPELPLVQYRSPSKQQRLPAEPSVGQRLPGVSGLPGLSDLSESPESPGGGRSPKLSGQRINRTNQSHLSGLSESPVARVNQSTLTAAFVRFIRDRVITQHYLQPWEMEAAQRAVGMTEAGIAAGVADGMVGW
jgi:hypothetical protein